MLQVDEPNEHTLRQRTVMDYIIASVLEAPQHQENANDRLRLIVHGPGGSGKSVILRAVAHKLRQAGIGVVIAAPTGVAAFNINGITLHSALSLPVSNNSYGKSTDVPPPRGVQLDNLRTFWKHASVLLLDEFGFVSAELLRRIDRHLRLATRRTHQPYGGIHIVMFGDLYQLPPPHGQPIFAAERLWTNFRLLELEGNQRAAQDPEFAALLARLRIGTWTRDDVQVLKSRVKRKRNGIHPGPYATHLHATREAVAVTNAKVYQQHIQDTHTQGCECPCIDTYTQTGEISDPENGYINAEDTGGLEAMLTIAVGSRVMYKQNWDVRDGLVNGACGKVTEIEDEQGQVSRIWVQFDRAGQRWCHMHQTFAVAVERRSVNYWGKNGKWIQRRQFPLVLAHASTVHKAQAATLPEGIYADLGRSIRNPGQAYTALSRVTRLSLVALKKFREESLIFNKDAEWALATLHEKQLTQDQHKNEALHQLWQQLNINAKPRKYYTQKLKRMDKPECIRQATYERTHPTAKRVPRASDAKEARKPKEKTTPQRPSKTNARTSQNRQPRPQKHVSTKMQCRPTSKPNAACPPGKLPPCRPSLIAATQSQPKSKQRTQSNPMPQQCLAQSVNRTDTTPPIPQHQIAPQKKKGKHLANFAKLSNRTIKSAHHQLRRNTHTRKF